MNPELLDEWYAWLRQKKHPRPRHVLELCACMMTPDDIAYVANMVRRFEETGE